MLIACGIENDEYTTHRLSLQQTRKHYELEHCGRERGGRHDGGRGKGEGKGERKTNEDEGWGSLYMLARQRASKTVQKGRRRRRPLTGVENRRSEMAGFNPWTSNIADDRYRSVPPK